MQTNNFHTSIAVNVTAKEAADNISRVSEWWMSTEGSSKELNDVFTVHIGKTFAKFKITELIPNRKIAWQVLDSCLPHLNDKTEWNGTTVVWEISSENNTTQIGMTHIGLVPGVECYEDCEKGWSFFVKESLFQLITQHKGLPTLEKVNQTT